MTLGHLRNSLWLKLKINEVYIYWQTAWRLHQVENQNFASKIYAENKTWAIVFLKYENFHFIYKTIQLITA